MTPEPKKEQRNSLLALFFLAILAVMLIPMPPLMLDAMSVSYTHLTLPTSDLV